MELRSLQSPSITGIPSSLTLTGFRDKPFASGQAIKFPNYKRFGDASNLKLVGFRVQASGSTIFSSEAVEAITKDANSKDDNLVFVAGATGKVGSRTVRELLKLGFKVRAGVRSAQRAESLLQSVQQMKLGDEVASEGTKPNNRISLVFSPAIEKLAIVKCDLEKRDQIGPALGNASVVICCIGASEKEVFDITGPYRIDYQATKNLIDAATVAKVNHFILLTSLGTNKVGFPAAILNLFWGVLIWKRKAEEALLASGLPYTIVRPGGMERPTDAYKETHNVTVSEEDTLFGGQVSNLQLFFVFQKNSSNFPAFIFLLFPTKLFFLYFKEDTKESLQTPLNQAISRSMEKTLEYLRRDERNVLDKSGPKIIRHKPITALLSPAELDPYIPLHTASEDLIYTGIRNCCEILEKGNACHRIPDDIRTSQPTVATKTPMDQFRTYLYSFLEDKDENMIQELFEGNGYELTALGRIRIKSVEIPSPTKSFDCSLNGSNESEDEFYDYTPLLDGTPTKMSKLPSANVVFSSPSNEPSKLLEKDHATLQNPWSTCGNHNLSPPPPKSLPAVHQESTSDTLEETNEINSDTSEEAQILADLLEANGVNKLFDKLEAPFASSGLLLGTSSNEAATHIQKGLTISLQSMTDVNGMIAVANNVFMILKSLGVDFISFYEKVKIFLGCFALKTQLADSSNLSTAEFEAQYCEKKLHFDKISGEHEQLSASIIKSDEQIAGLNQRIIQTKELLKQLEEELSSTQAEHASFMCDFTQASESVSKSEEDVQTALNVLSQHKKKNGQHSVVERAFERAKASLNE
ncbi:unnamed protein product [Camellia sinensis]